MERKLRITVEGRVYNVTVEDLSDSGSLLYPGRGSMTIPAPTALEVPSAPAVAPGDVVATLGGVVESVAVVPGQAVRQGDTVVVLEAMKMNSPMVAPRAGTVASVAVKVGDLVESGQVLATIA